jgi:DNA-binding transcriptional ArsR family regulator
VMKHVRLLEEANLVITEKHGRSRECSLGPERMEDVVDWIERYRIQWEQRLDRLGEIVERRKERHDDL